MPAAIMPTQEPKTIVNKVVSYLADTVPAGQKLSNLRLEEIKTDKDGLNWSVVLSYDSEGAFAFDKTRLYKKFLVSDADARVLSMEKAEG